MAKFDEAEFEKANGITSSDTTDGGPSVMDTYGQPEQSTGMAALRGAIKGATFGSAPYWGALGHTEAPTPHTLGEAWQNIKNFPERYKQGLAQEKLNYLSAAEQHPMATMGGEMLGGTPAMLATGGRVAPMAGISGVNAGMTESYNPNATMGSIAGASAVGAGTGALFQGLGNAGSKYVANRLGRSVDEIYNSLVEQAKKANFPNVNKTTLFTKAETKNMSGAEKSALTDERQQIVADHVNQQLANPLNGFMGSLGGAGLGVGLGYGAGELTGADKNTQAIMEFIGLGGGGFAARKSLANLATSIGEKYFTNPNGLPQRMVGASIPQRFYGGSPAAGQVPQTYIGAAGTVAGGTAAENIPAPVLGDRLRALSNDQFNESDFERQNGITPLQ